MRLLLVLLLLAFRGSAHDIRRWRPPLADCWSGTWGSLVTAAAAGAPPGRRVWVDLFAVRQWSGNAADLDFVGVIRRCKAVLLVAEALPAVAALDFDDCAEGRAEVPEEARRVVAFMRIWCLVGRPPFLSPAPVCLSPPGGEEPFGVCGRC